eukprot:jgi/Tetstr1/446494/TSEL_034022.t1
METLMDVRHLTKKGDYMFSFNLHDGFYAVGIAPSDRDYFTAFSNVLAGHTSRFPEMMAELRRLWYMLDSNGIHVRARYIRSAANVWADCMSGRMDNDD